MNRYKKDAVTPLQQNFLTVLEKHLGVITPACAEAGIARNTFYKWQKNSPFFADAVEDVQTVTLDFAENQLLARMKDKSDAAIIFFLKCKGRGRGYIEKQTLVLEMVNDDDLLREAKRRLAARSDTAAGTPNRSE